jgi:fido (protein-threonine AMPylation protein)
VELDGVEQLLVNLKRKGVLSKTEIMALKAATCRKKALQKATQCMSFDPFGDFETEGYLQNSLKLKDPIEVKESEHLSFEASIDDALAYLAKKKPIDYKAVLKHTKYFSQVFTLGRERQE